MKNEIIDIIRQNTNTRIDITDETTFMDIDIDSLGFISMVIKIEEEFNIRFEDMQLVYDNYKNIGQFIEVVQKEIVKTNKKESIQG